MCWVSEINLVSGELFFDFQEFIDFSTRTNKWSVQSGGNEFGRWFLVAVNSTSQL